MIALAAPLARERDIRLNVNTEGFQRETRVLADRNRLNQVVLNVLSNAIKYNRTGGRVDVSFAATDGGRVRMSITDTGIGIQPDMLAEAFEPLERLGAELTEIEGTGLWFDAVQRAGPGDGGKIEVSSRRGVGTTFVVELAACEPPCANEPQVLPCDYSCSRSSATRMASGRVSSTSKTTLPT